MMSVQAYPRLRRIVLLGIAFACVAAGQALAQARGHAQVLLLPGRSMTFVDVERPGVNVVLTAPPDAYLDVSKLAAAGEKHGIFTVLTTVQVRPAGRLAWRADGSVALRPAFEEGYFLPVTAAPMGGRVLIEGGAAVHDRGRVTIYSNRVVSPVVPAAPQLMHTELPQSGPQAAASAPQAVHVASAETVVIAPGGAVTVLDAPQAGPARPAGDSVPR